MSEDSRVLSRVLAERARQETKWGEQNHDDGVWLAILTEEVGEAAQGFLAESFDPSDHGNAQVEEEVVHVAAVAINWLGAIERRRRFAGQVNAALADDCVAASGPEGQPAGE